MNYVKMTDAELDALVAERVMGWERQLNDVWCTPDGWLPVTWSPTTDANAMMEVMARMHEKGYAISITWERVDEHPRCSMILDVAMATVKTHKAPIGRAVCIAALRAVEK